MSTSYSYSIFTSTKKLPENWNDLAISNIFLSKEYLQIIEKSAPENMICHFIGIFHDTELIGIALCQFLDLNQLQSFGERDKCIKTMVRNFIFRNFSSHILIIGNNMLTGQNAFAISKKAEPTKIIQALNKASEELKNHFKSIGKKIHLTTIKDFSTEEIDVFNIPEFKDYLKFSTQPNMTFPIRENWKREQDYIDALSKKYRDQYKRTRKKALGIEKRKMHLDEIIANEAVIYDLYFHVAQNASFNTFFLAKNHFRIFKEKLKDKFLFYGYFLDEKLIGFNTLIKNGTVLDTYFLGYDDSVQREKMLYLNMLYDMVAYSINKGFKEIVLARTALEIKSSVGAEPIKMYGLMKHSNFFINKKLGYFFKYLEPETIWKERNPFK
nr:8-amino-7-oxononanoate synthase [uncultured Flavobacterium sp.]